MSDLDKDVESEVTLDMWRKKATTAARYDLCNQCKYFSPQEPFKPGIRCIFGLRPDVILEGEKAQAKCNVFERKKE